MKKTNKQAGTKRVLITLDPDELAKLATAAHIKNLTIQNYIVQLISIDIIRQEWQQERMNAIKLNVTLKKPTL